MAATDLVIKTGLNTTWPMTFAQDRFGRVIGVNGIDRGIHWDTFSATADKIGIDAPVGIQSVAGAGGTSGTISGIYNCYYRYVDDRDGHKRYSDLSPVVATADLDRVTEIEWTALAQSLQSRVNKIELWRTAFAQTNTNKLYLIATLGHNGTITSTDEDGPTGTVTFTLPKGHGLIVGSIILVAGHSVAGYNTSHEILVVTSGADADVLRTDFTHATDGDPGGTWTVTGFKKDTNTDATLQALEFTSSFMLLTKPDGDYNANRFGVPPTNMGVVVRFQDRMLYAVPRPYSAGTVATTAGSSVVTGSGTTFISDMVGKSIEIDGQAKPYVIASFTSSTSIKLEEAALSSGSSKSYSIRPSATELNQIRFTEVDEPESAPATWTITVQENIDDRDRMTGLIPFGNQIIACKERHLYRLWFYDQPTIDAGVSLWQYRGLVNQRCWDVHEGVLFLMDERGPYRIGKGGVEPIGNGIQDTMRDGTIDWANKRWFFVHIDPLEELVYFFVGFAADSSTRPRRAFVWSIRREQWMPGPDEYAWEIGDIAKIEVSGQQKSVMATENDLHYFLNDGTFDGTAGSNTVRGTATASASTTLTDSAATFPTDAVGSTIAIVRGTGKGQIRRISTRNSGTQVTVSAAWTTNPSTDSVYVVGAIEYSYKTGQFRLVPSGQENNQAFRVAFTPTTNDAEFYLRRFMNHSASATNHDYQQDNNEQGIDWSAADADTICDIKLTRSTLEDEIGDHRWEWGGKSHMGHDQAKPKNLWVACELAGFQNQDQHKIHEIQIEGAV